MTDQQKIELIKAQLDMTPAEFDELPAEQREFLEREWDATPRHDRLLFHDAWGDVAGSLEHAIKTANLTDEEIRAAAKVLRTVWANWRAAGVSDQQQRTTEAHQLIDAIEWRASKTPQQFVITAMLSDAMKRDPETNGAVLDALRRFTAHEWGEVPQEDAEANDRDEAEGCGRVLARYKAPDDDIYIISYPGTDQPATIMYCYEY